MESRMQNVTTKHPSVCVISPFYNRSHGVRNTLESLHAQTYENVEFLIWDDCSTDNTWEELQHVASELRDPRLKIFRNSSNLGLSAGLNKAISMTNSKYIAVIGSGDGCDADRIKLQVAALESDPDAVLCTAAAITLDIKSGARFRDTSFDRSIVHASDMTARCVVPHGAVMYRREDVVLLGGYAEELTWCADWDLFNRLLQRGHGLYLQRTLSFRIAQADGVSFQPEKAFDQLACKQLVIQLASLSQHSRAELLDRIKKDGATSVVGNKSKSYARDLARRNVKLFLMGRRTDAMRMAQLADEKNISYPMIYRLYLIAARSFTTIFRSNYKLIALARYFIR